MCVWCRAGTETLDCVSVSPLTSLVSLTLLCHVSNETQTDRLPICVHHVHMHTRQSTTRLSVASRVSRGLGSWASARLRSSTHQPPPHHADGRWRWPLHAAPHTPFSAHTQASKRPPHTAPAHGRALASRQLWGLNETLPLASGRGGPLWDTCSHSWVEISAHRILIITPRTPRVF